MLAELDCGIVAIDADAQVLERDLDRARLVDALLALGIPGGAGFAGGCLEVAGIGAEVGLDVLARPGGGPQIDGSGYLGDTQNVIDYLLAALDNHNGQGQVFEIGGPHVTTYQELMLSYARVRGLKRRFLLLPYVPVWFMAFGIGLTTPVPRPIAYALVGGLSSDSVVIHDNARKIYPEVNLIDFESAAREALTRLHPHRLENVWEDGSKTIKHEGFFIDHRKIKTQVAPKKIFQLLKEKLGITPMEAAEENQMLVHLKIRIPGDLWVEWRASQKDTTCLMQTIFFTPRGLGGFLFWYMLHPFFIWYLSSLRAASIAGSQKI